MREGQDRRVQQVPRRLGDDQGEDHGAHDEQDQADPVDLAHPPDARAGARGWVWPWPRRRTVWVSPRPGPALPVHRDHDGDEDQEVREARLVEVVEADERLHDADGDPAEEGPRERDHPGDDRGGQGPGQGARSEVVEVLGRARHAGQEGQRQRGQTTREGPDRGGDHLRADAGEAGEVGVLGGRLDRLAQGRAVEQPAEADGDERDDDEDGELRARRSGSPATSFTDPIGTGKRAPGASISGKAARMASESWAMPIVATSTITRGALKSRRITISSTSAPNSVPTTSADRQRRASTGTPYCADHQGEERRRRGSRCWPTAKLMTRVDR